MTEESKKIMKFDDAIAVGEYYTIPYRCLIPKNTDNLLVAGRCVSTTHEAMASIRIMPIVCCIGEAAGNTAGIADREDKKVRDISIEKLQKILKNGYKQ